MYDLIIIGGGPAGLSAAIHAKRFNLKYALIEKNKLGGQARVANWIENYPGFPNGISGSDLMALFIKQVEKFDVRILKSEVIKIIKKNDSFMIKCLSDEFTARLVIVATGLVPRRLEIPGALYYPDPAEVEHKGKSVLVIGGGDCAFDQAISFSKKAASVTIAMRSERSRCTRRLYDEAVSREITILKSHPPLNPLPSREGKIGFDIVVVDIGKEKRLDVLDMPLRATNNERRAMSHVFLAGDILHPKIRHIAAAVGDGILVVEKIYENYFQNR